MEVFHAAAVHAETAEPLIQSRIISCTQAGIPESAKIFAGEETKATDRADRSGTPALVLRPDGLRGILDDRNATIRRGCEERVEIGTPSEQVNRQHGFDILPANRLHRLLRVHIEVLRLDIDKHRRGAKPGDGG